MSTVLHLMPLHVWQRLGDGEPVTNPSLGREGFLHCTDDASVLIKIANAFYSNEAGDFVVLHVDVQRLTSRCVWEAPAHIDGSTGPSFAPAFPHIYGPIDRVAVAGVQPVLRDDLGRFTGYGAVSPVA